MRAVIQRVSHASVTINGTKKSETGKGFLVLLGIENPDTEEDVAWLVKKIGGLRVFDDENGVMNLSVKDINGEILVVSQFTLMASTKKATARHTSAPQVMTWQSHYTKSSARQWKTSSKSR